VLILNPYFSRLPLPSCLYSALCFLDPFSPAEKARLPKLSRPYFASISWFSEPWPWLEPTVVLFFPFFFPAILRTSSSPFPSLPPNFLDQGSTHLRVMTVLSFYQATHLGFTSSLLLLLPPILSAPPRAERKYRITAKPLSQTFPHQIPKLSYVFSLFSLLFAPFLKIPYM